YQGCPNILGMKVREVCQYFSLGHSACEILEDIYDGDASSADDWLPATDLWIQCDSVDKARHRISSGNGYSRTVVVLRGQDKKARGLTVRFRGVRPCPAPSACEKS